MGVWDRLRAALGVARVPPVTTPHAVTTIEYDRQPLAAWQAMLDAAHVPGTARLVVAWEPGDVWQPIHRWMLWQLQDWAHVPDAVKAELTGPHPRSRGHYCAPGHCDCKGELGQPKHVYRWKGGATTLIDRRTWELARAHHASTGQLVWPRRLWVVQGTTGGHAFMISSAEQKLRREEGLPADVPSAGDLPYAEPDARVLAALERYDLFRFAHGLGDPLTAPARTTIARLTATEVAAHRLMWSRMATLAEEWADGAAHAARQDGLHYHRWGRVGEKPATPDLEAVRDRFIHDTEFTEAA